MPLDAINAASAREKSIRHGHPSTLHLWWSRKPLAAARAVLFASLVDDPSSRPERWPTVEAQTAERERLFGIIERLVRWENINNSDLLAEAHAEIADSCDGELPTMLDPFAGGGSIPLEAQRLGLKAVASDLNPVAVLINKAQIEIPPRFADCPPVHPDQEGAAQLRSWSGAQGLADDVAYYGQWMREEAERRIGHLYPKDTGPGGEQLTPIAWLWARTVRSPDPAWNGHVPLARSFVLSKKKGREAWVEPIVDRQAQTINYEIRHGDAANALEGTVGRGGGRCLATGTAMPFPYIREEGRAGRMGQQLMAIVAEGDRQRVYLPPTAGHVEAAQVPLPETPPPRGDLPHNPRNFNTPNYGLTEWVDLFTPRQLVALTTFSDLLGDVSEMVSRDAATVGMAEDGLRLRASGSGAQAYGEAVVTYLAFVVDKCADYWSSICTWNSPGEKIRSTFARQAIAMNWETAETNPFSDSTGNWMAMVDWVHKAVDHFPALVPGEAVQRDAQSAVSEQKKVLVSTDPPYYDNIGYADLSDFFYVWLRRNLANVWPDVCSTLLVPKADELVATPYRFDGDKRRAEEFFESGLTEAFRRFSEEQDERFPFTVYYAFKQAETTKGGVASTGWETMLQSLVDAGFVINGTWPLRTERSGRPVAVGTNALASSIVLACRRRPSSAPLASRREFLSALKAELPEALRLLRQGGIAPVDMAQAAIGPGMAVFSRYERVIEASGESMRVRTALELINETLDEVTREIDADFDYDTRWAVSWFSEYGFEEGEFGRAELLSKSRNTSVSGLVEAGIVEAGAGRVRLLRLDELDLEWDPATDDRFTVWEVAHHLIRRIHDLGEQSAATLLRAVGGHGDSAKELAYRLYLICERKNWAAEALGYNSLVTSWAELTKLATQAPATATTLL